SGCEVQVDIGASGYSLKVRDDANAGCLTANLSFNTSLKNPAGGTFNIPDTAPPAGIAVSAANFIYGRQGQTFSAANILINVDTQTITVDAVTGYVH
ncbi:MAG TPA: hypothetical protein VFX02_03450, partial [Gammaproteobacteria bacterium]|nr:hypothetical protein [Gammaproteobacteria bacterium]